MSDRADREGDCAEPKFEKGWTFEAGGEHEKAEVG